ncbi:MAG: hypothetical protein KGL39_57755 [Patescibacteria group bacterium]|nr:hypothetical protein [Patescibacteria group bacterium]
MIDNKWLRRQYVAYNKRFFHDLLPEKLVVRFADINDKWAGVTCFDGDTKEPYEISIDKHLIKYPRYAKLVLLHELCHVSVGQKEKQYHGILFKKEIKRLLDAGAFTPLL